MTCRWNREAEAYLTSDGDPCRTDEYGDPTKHCTARRSCAVHIGRDEMTCPRCIGRVRADLHKIPPKAALMLPVALGAGVDSQAANLAGPAADVEAWSWRKIAAKQGVAWHVSLIEEDDEQHPYSVLARWEAMIREDYDQPRETPTSIESAAEYLTTMLGRIAQDPEQDFPLMAREIRKCHQHLENVLATARYDERGVPCPDCTSPETGLGPRLRLEPGHWCNREDCEKVHYDVLTDHETGELVPDTTGDMWVCPRNPVGHRWTHAVYTQRLEDRKAAV